MEIYKTSTETWKYFSKYHYLNHNINRSAQCYIGLIHNIPVAFIAVLHFPHAKVNNYKRISRLVVLPDYQGIGIGTKLLDLVSRLYKDKGFRVIITTSNPALCHHFDKSKVWVLKRHGFVRHLGSSSTVSGLDNTSSKTRLTTSWEYIL